MADLAGVGAIEHCGNRRRRVERLVPLGIAASARLTRPLASRRTRSSRRQRSQGDDLEHHSLTRKWTLCEQPARTESV
jgi:hypothetical protein